MTLKLLRVFAALRVLPGGAWGGWARAEEPALTPHNLRYL